MSIHKKIGMLPIGVDQDCCQWRAQVSNITKSSLMVKAVECNASRSTTWTLSS